MQLVYQCSHCQMTNRAAVDAGTEALDCAHCGTVRALHRAAVVEGVPRACVLCGCNDLWRQKDFPPQLGLTIVGLGAILSSIAWSMYWPKTAIAVLMAFALVDLVLYAVMSDVLVCYRCGSRHRKAKLDDAHPRFNLEISERYRQEALRLEKAQRNAS